MPTIHPGRFIAVNGRGHAQCTSIQWRFMLRRTKSRRLYARTHMPTRLTMSFRELLRLPMLVGLLLWSACALAQPPSLDRVMAHNARALGTQLVMRGQERGARLLYQVAAQGDAKAQFNLAVAYMNGDIKGGAQPQTALHWYAKAAAAGYAPAAYNAGVLHAARRVPGATPAHATYWMCRAAAMQHPRALRWLSSHRAGLATCRR